jgi:hypothetical protein
MLNPPKVETFENAMFINEEPINPNDKNTLGRNKWLKKPLINFPIPKINNEALIIIPISVFENPKEPSMNGIASEKFCRTKKYMV